MVSKNDQKNVANGNEESKNDWKAVSLACIVGAGVVVATVCLGHFLGQPLLKFLAIGFSGVALVLSILVGLRLVNGEVTSKWMELLAVALSMIALLVSIFGF